MLLDTTIDQVYGVIPVKKIAGEWNFLIIKSRKGNWGFPKGHAHPGESPIAAAVREFKEETGIADAFVYEKMTYSESHAVEADTRVTAKHITWFLGLVTGEIPSVAPDFEEIVEIRWAVFNDAFTRLKHDTTKNILLGVHEHLTKNGI